MSQAKTVLFTALVLATTLGAQGLHIGPVDPAVPHDPKVAHRHPPRPRPWRRPAPPQIVLEDLRVETKIVDGVATTQLTQTFFNRGQRIGEGTWILPLPPGAIADRFTMTMNGSQVAGEVLDANKARTIYTNIVRSQRDPGLLEYVGHGALRARIFPIPGNGRIKIEVRYRQILSQTAGLHEWTFPLRAATAGGRPAQKISLDLTIKTKTPLKNVYSPSSGAHVVRKGDHEARVSLETKKGQMAARDLAVFYGLTEQEFGLNLLTYRDKGQAGYFMLMLAPKRDWPEQPNMVKVVNFVLDTSGSMQGEKIQQARGALRYFLQSLKPHDYFNVIPFSTEPQPFFPAPVVASKDNLDNALGQVEKLEARGGTNIGDSMAEAMKAGVPALEGKTMVPITVFLTDGLPTVGTTDVNQLLSTVKQHNKSKYRVFVFGVGNDVNTHLLDKMAAQNRGDRDYVRPGEDIEVKTGALFSKLSNPVMTDVVLSCDAIKAWDLFPKRTPDLFKGSRLLVVGRYEGEGQKAIRLKGKVNGKDKEFVFEGTFAAGGRSEHDFIPALWAERKVAQLLEAIRLNGQKPELLNEVKRLGKQFGIVTPYTSHLILEDHSRVARARWGRADLFAQGNDGQRDRGRVRRELERRGFGGRGGGALQDEDLEELDDKAKADGEKARKKLGDMPGKVEGKSAVQDSMQLLKQSRAAGPSTPGLAGSAGRSAGMVTQRIKDRTFHLANGVWVDSRFKKEMKDKIRKIEAFSKDYFELLQKHAKLAPCLAFSTSILIVVDGQGIEIHEKVAETPKVEAPKEGKKEPAASKPAPRIR